MAQASIDEKYASLGGASGPLGSAASQLITDTATGISHINYANGAIYYTTVDNAHAIYGRSTRSGLL